ncbi:MAG: PqqD family protein [Jatrophihabitantaceae bacterium]
MAMADPCLTGVRAMREQAFGELAAAMPAANLDAAARCGERLRAALPHQDKLDRNLVMVAYGGGKDSAYTLAFVRAMQLILYRSVGSTFRLRVATNRHAGMPRAVLENIDREYRALRLPADEACELLLIDGDEVSEFDVDSPQRPHIVRRNRVDILMTGHRTFGDGRPTFCNACNLSVVNALGLAAGYGAGADLIITGDSKQEQRQYTLWVGRLARQLVPDRAAVGVGLGRFLSTVDNIAQTYFADIHGEQAAIAERRVRHDVPERLRFFSIYSDTEYASGDHMELLTGFLGFEFDDIAFSFTESDCGNPALMAHLRGLKCERVYQRPYAEGMREYVDFAVGLMRSKDFPDQLIEQVQARYASPAALAEMRQAAEVYAQQTFGLTEAQLVCLVYSPFAEKGAGLAGFLRREHPRLADSLEEIQLLLADQLPDAPELVAELERISGLSMAQLRLLYRSSLTGRRAGERAGIIDALLADDPHKAVIQTRHSSDGPATAEQISGR